MTTLIMKIVIIVVAGIIADELTGWMPRLAQRLIQYNAKRLPLDSQSRMEEEWLAHFEDLPGRLSKLLLALGTFISAYSILSDSDRPNFSLRVSMVLRGFDLIFAIISVCFFLPLLLIVAILIKLDSRGPIFYKQKYVGKNGKTFVMYSFRTVYENSFSIGGRKNIFMVKDEPRVTRVGRILRRTAINELPKLFNVIRGDMSLVGHFR